MRVFKLLPILSLGLLASGCASLVSGQTQDVTILTPGAEEAECTLDNGVRYAVTSGETIQVMRNESDIVVDCYASGNRHRKISIESDGNGWAIGNIVTGIVPGVTFDHFAKGLYEYPETITVDFIGVPTLGFELPTYHNKDAPNPYEQSIEDFGPSTPKRDVGETNRPTPVKKKTRENTDPFGSMAPEGAGVSGSGDAITPLPGSASKGPTTYTAPSGTLSGSNAEELTRSMNPTVFRTNN
jgi:hypothetical protein